MDTLFYIENDFDQPLVLLDEQESHHLKNVLRAKVNDKLQLINGKGMLCTAEIIAINKRNTEITVIEKIFFEKKTPFLHIAIAPTKNADRTEWFVEKAIEIGIQKISFIICKNSERKSVNTERIKRVAIAALKQNKSYWLPEISAATPFSKFIEETQAPEKYIAHCRNSESNKLMLNNYTDTVILIGPEGDFTETEIATALQNNYNNLTLGEGRLRTETAGIVACSQFNFLKSKTHV